MKPVLLGMNAPNSSEPLDPDSDSGRRLVDLIGRDAFDCYDRSNVIERRIWSRIAARARAQEVRLRMVNRHVIVLGNETWLTLSLPKAKILGCVVLGTTTWHRVPHPSGRNPLYSIEKNRVAARRLMREVAGVN